jgi:DNA-binding IclR family transcriptional regulator
MDKPKSTIRDRVKFDERLAIGGRNVKSAARCLQIIEILDSVRTGLNGRTISSILQIPTSSTDYILKTMVSLGHIDYDQGTRTYTLSHRIALLGSWLNSHLIREGPVVRTMDEICDHAGVNVILLTLNGLFTQVIHVVYPDRADQPFVPVGRSSPLLSSPSGYSLLSQMSDAEIKTLVRRYNAEQPNHDRLVDIGSLLAIIEQVRRDGYAFDAPTGAGWVVAIPLPGLGGSQPLAIGVGSFGPEASVAPETLLAFTHQALHKWHRHIR